MFASQTADLLKAIGSDDTAGIENILETAQPPAFNHLLLTFYGTAIREGKEGITTAILVKLLSQKFGSDLPLIAGLFRDAIYHPDIRLEEFKSLESLFFKTLTLAQQVFVLAQFERRVPAEWKLVVDRLRDEVATPIKRFSQDEPRNPLMEEILNQCQNIDDIKDAAQFFVMFPTLHPWILRINYGTLEESHRFFTEITTELTRAFSTIPEYHQVKAMSTILLLLDTSASMKEWLGDFPPNLHTQIIHDALCTALKKDEPEKVQPLLETLPEEKLVEALLLPGSSETVLEAAANHNRKAVYAIFATLRLYPPSLEIFPEGYLNQERITKLVDYFKSQWELRTRLKAQAEVEIKPNETAAWPKDFKQPSLGATDMSSIATFPIAGIPADSTPALTTQLPVFTT